MTKKVFTYKVTGRGAFPVDMLRYDVATAASNEDQSLMDAHTTFRNTETFTVSVTSPYRPTVERWNSFGWKVENDKS